MASQLEEQVVMYSALDVLREKLDCFLLNHEIMANPRQLHSPEVLFLSVTLPSHSESVYPYNL